MLYADKDEYIAKNLTFTIKHIKFQAGAGFEGADRWAVTVAAEDGRPDEIITLQSNEKRDAELQAAAAHIEAMARFIRRSWASPERPTTSATLRRAKNPSITKAEGRRLHSSGPPGLIYHGRA